SARGGADSFHGEANRRRTLSDRGAESRARSERRRRGRSRRRGLTGHVALVRAPSLRRTAVRRAPVRPASRLPDSLLPALRPVRQRLRPSTGLLRSVLFDADVPRFVLLHSAAILRTARVLQPAG